MRTKIFTWLIVTIFAVALVYFFKTQRLANKDGLNLIGERSPVITMDGLNLWLFKGDRAEWKLSAQNAVFVSPDILELKTSVKYMRTATQNPLTVMAESALFNFESQGILGIKNESQLREVLLEDEVVIKDQNYEVHTKSARYSPQEKRLTSVDPVRVESQSMKIMGDSGFVYMTEKSQLEMEGEIQGEIIRDQE